MRLVLLLFVLGISGCVASGHQQFYKSYGDPRTLPDAQLLAEGQTPTIYSSNDLDRDVKILVSKGYWPIGHSSFNGSLEGESQVSAQAARVGALVVLVRSAYTNTQTNTTPLFLPNNTTTHASGTAYGTGGTASYYGSATTYGTTVVPVTSQQRRFDQEAVYFVKVNRKYKYGVQLADLTPEARASIQRNTGALISLVFEGSPAFLANLLPGDILTRIDGVDVINVEHASKLMGAAGAPGRHSVVTILRNGEEKTISVTLGSD